MKEWKAMGEIPEVNSDGQIDPLEALRFKMESGKVQFVEFE